MAGEIEHDWERWGSAFTVDGRPVTRIADVVKSMLSARRPLKVAADHVVECIAASKDAELFVFRRNYVVAALYVGGHWDGPLRVDSWFGYDVKDVHESEFLEWWDWTDGTTDPFREAKGDPRRLHGAIGMLAVMHYLWTQRATTPDDLDNLPTGGIAILTSVAEALFGLGSGAGVAASSTDYWTGERLATRRDELKHLKEWMPTLEAESGLSERNIQRRIEKSERANLRVNLPDALTGVAESTGLNWTAPMPKVAKASKSKS